MTLNRGTLLAQQFFLFLLVVLTRDLPGIRVSSYTTGIHTDGSQHPLGTAIDLGVRTATERARAQELARRWRSLGLTALDEGDHIHLQLFPAAAATLVV